MRVIRKPRPQDMTNDPHTLQLLRAVKKNNAYRVKQVVENGADPNAPLVEGFTPLLFALFWPENLAAIEALLAAGADPNLGPEGTSKGMSPIGAAVQFEDSSALRLMLAHGGDPNRNNAWEPLFLTAAYRNQLENVKLLAAAGAEIYDRAHERSAMMAFAFFSWWEGVLWALDRGDDPRERTFGGKSFATLVDEDEPPLDAPGRPAWEEIVRRLPR